MVVNLYSIETGAGNRHDEKDNTDMLSVGQLLFRDRAIVIGDFFFRRAEREVVHSQSGDDEQWNIHIVILSEFEWAAWGTFTSTAGGGDRSGLKRKRS